MLHCLVPPPHSPLTTAQRQALVKLGKGREGGGRSSAPPPRPAPLRIACLRRMHRPNGHLHQGPAAATAAALRLVPHFCSNPHTNQSVMMRHVNGGNRRRRGALREPPRARMVFAAPRRLRHHRGPAAKAPLALPPRGVGQSAPNPGLNRIIGGSGLTLPPNPPLARTP